MRVWLYRRKLDLHSGAGQLMRMQAFGLRAAGVQPVVACERGALRFFLQTGLPTRRTAPAALRDRARAGNDVLVDHECLIPEADVIFVHNVDAEASAHLPTALTVQRLDAERSFFRSLRSDSTVVANSALTAAALVRHFDLSPDRIVVHHPGFVGGRFAVERAAALRRAARRSLRVDEMTPLVGFVTSGDFAKRGIDLFLASAVRIAAALPAARFLVVGGRRPPDALVGNPLFATGKVHYRPKNHRPERWIAALDVFLYAARFEEFGMVVLEAQALGVPVVTSRRVGAAECLPSAYEPWLDPVPDSARFAATVLRWLDDPALRMGLAGAGVVRARLYDHRRYAGVTAATILAQKRRLR